MTSRFGRWPLAITGVLVVVVAGLISVGRLLATNPNAVGEVLWAEDGLFPLCVRRDGAIDCLTDAYAGYFLFVPRVIAIVVAGFDFSDWAAVANIAAAVVVGLSAAGTFAALIHRSVGYITSVFAALLVVLVPIAGVEALNVYATNYTPLLVVSAVAVAFPAHRRWGTWATAFVLLVTAMTIPSAVVMFLGIGYQWLRKVISRTQVLIMGGALLLGLIVQGIVVVGAPNRRDVAISWETFVNWVNAIPKAIATLVPGVNVGESTDVFGLAQLPASVLLGWFVLALVLVPAFLLLRRSTSETQQGAGLLLIMGVLVGAIPSITGYVSNRYFVVPVVLWLTAVLVIVDDALRRHDRSAARQSLVAAVIAAVLLVLWWPSLPATTLRATGTPNWSEMVADVDQYCPGNPDQEIRFRFTPYDWPPGEPAQVPAMMAPCRDILR